VINNIKCKYGQTKVNGPNPFDYLGYKYSEDGSKLYLFEGINGKWEAFSDLNCYTLEKTASESNRVKFFRLSDVKHTYDWINGNGYENISNWVK